MIISASYKTDIPTFYGEWFMNRLRAGYCKMVNPYGRQVYMVNLKRKQDDEGREGVDGIVFWTKNVGPFLDDLRGIARRGYPFVVQHTINGYPRELEARVIDYERTVECTRILKRRYGPEAVIWRYDPIVISSLTPIDWHRQNFAKLAKALKGTTHEVVVSFAQIYKKAERNMNAAEEVSTSGFTWRDHTQTAYPQNPHDNRAVALVAYLAGIAAAYDMQLKVCSQERYLVPGIIEEAHCIDATWFGQEFKRHGNRKECACSASRDIGEYDTCPHGCIYCYAVQDREKALDRYKKHDPTSEFLFQPDFPTIPIQPRTKTAKAKPQQRRTSSGKTEEAQLALFEKL